MIRCPSEKITSASVTPSSNLLIEGNPVNLTCETTGTVFSRMWMKDDLGLVFTENMTLMDVNRTVSFKSLNHRDSGRYSCKLSNPISTMNATYIMAVNCKWPTLFTYSSKCVPAFSDSCWTLVIICSACVTDGPQNIGISGPSEIHSDQTLTLKCSAESKPAATYTWTVNGIEIHNSSVFTKVITGVSDSGNYTCQAMNNVTGRTSVAIHGLSVTGSKLILVAHFARVAFRPQCLTLRRLFLRTLSN